MLKFKLQRVGKKHAPQYRVIVTEERSAVSKFTEIVGSFDPVKNVFNVNKEVVLEWIKKGVQPTYTVMGLFIKNGVLEGKQRQKTKKQKQLEEKK